MLWTCWTFRRQADLPRARLEITNATPSRFCSCATYVRARSALLHLCGAPRTGGAGGAHPSPRHPLDDIAGRLCSPFSKCVQAYTLHVGLLWGGFAVHSCTTTTPPHAPPPLPPLPLASEQRLKARRRRVIYCKCNGSASPTGLAAPHAALRLASHCFTPHKRLEPPEAEGTRGTSASVRRSGNPVSAGPFSSFAFRGGGWGGGGVGRLGAVGVCTAEGHAASPGPRLKLAKDQRTACLPPAKKRGGVAGHARDARAGRAPFAFSPLGPRFRGLVARRRTGPTFQPSMCCCTRHIDRLDSTSVLRGTQFLTEKSGCSFQWLAVSVQFRRTSARGLSVPNRSPRSGPGCEIEASELGCGVECHLDLSWEKHTKERPFSRPVILRVELFTSFSVPKCVVSSVSSESTALCRFGLMQFRLAEQHWSCDSPVFTAALTHTKFLLQGEMSPYCKILLVIVHSTGNH